MALQHAMHTCCSSCRPWLPFTAVTGRDLTTHLHLAVRNLDLDPSRTLRVAHAPAAMTMPSSAPATLPQPTTHGWRTCSAPSHLAGDDDDASPRVRASQQLRDLSTHGGHPMVLSLWCPHPCGYTFYNEATSARMFNNLGVSVGTLELAIYSLFNCRG